MFQVGSEGTGGNGTRSNIELSNFPPGKQEVARKVKGCQDLQASDYKRYEKQVVHLQRSGHIPNFMDGDCELVSLCTEDKVLSR